MLALEPHAATTDSCQHSSSYHMHRLRKYASPRVPLLVRLIAGVGWFTSISIIAIVPIDVWTTLNGGDNSSIFIMWKICYWYDGPESTAWSHTTAYLLEASCL